MNSEPREIVDYNRRQVEAARRVLVDLGQVLASFADCMVLIGGWVPDLLLVDATEPHVGSIDVDIALDATKLGNGRYAELLKLLLDTRRYYRGHKDFQLIADVDLEDGESPVQVEMEFLAPSQVKLKKNRPKLLDGFRVLQTAACGIAFHDPLELALAGKTVRGAQNTVRLRVASLADFLTMKAHAIAGRDKPKDSYDLCYCLEHVPGGIEVLAEAWRKNGDLKEVGQAIAILTEKFSAIDAFGPSQVMDFHNSSDADTRAMQARRAYELVTRAEVSSTGAGLKAMRWRKTLGSGLESRRALDLRRCEPELHRYGWEASCRSKVGADRLRMRRLIDCEIRMRAKRSACRDKNVKNQCVSGIFEKSLLPSATATSWLYCSASSGILTAPSAAISSSVSSETCRARRNIFSPGIGRKIPESLLRHPRPAPDIMKLVISRWKGACAQVRPAIPQESGKAGSNYFLDLGTPI